MTAMLIKKVRRTVPRRMVIYYFSLPTIIGLFFGNIVGLDISDLVNHYVGILQFLEQAGIAIQIKSIILLAAIICSPLILAYIHYHLRNHPHETIARNAVHTEKILFILAIVGAIMVAGVFYILSISNTATGKQFLLTAIGKDIPFGLFTSFAALALIVLPFSLIAKLTSKSKDDNSDHHNQDENAINRKKW